MRHRSGYEFRFHGHSAKSVVRKCLGYPTAVFTGRGPASEAERFVHHCISAHAPTSLPNPPIVPADRRRHSRWADRHKAVVEAMHSHPDAQLLLIGDSIINNYDVLLKLRLYR